MRRWSLAGCAACVAAMVLAGCNDLRDFRGDWAGGRVGSGAPLVVGAGSGSQAELTIDALDPNGLSGELTVGGVISAAPVASLAGAEADALSTLSFTGSPLHVYLAFVDTTDGGGAALAMIALFEDRRVDVRVLRGGTAPIYAIYTMTEATGSAAGSGSATP